MAAVDKEDWHNGNQNSRTVYRTCTICEALCGLELKLAGSDGSYSLRLPSGPVGFDFNALPPEFTYPEQQVVKRLGIKRGQPDVDNVAFTIARKQEANAEDDSPSVSTADARSQRLRDIRAASQPLLGLMASQHGYGLSRNELIRHVPRPFPPAPVFNLLGHRRGAVFSRLIGCSATRSWSRRPSSVSALSTKPNT